MTAVPPMLVAAGSAMVVFDAQDLNVRNVKTSEPPERHVARTADLLQFYPVTNQAQSLAKMLLKNPKLACAVRIELHKRQQTRMMFIRRKRSTAKRLSEKRTSRGSSSTAAPSSRSSSAAQAASASGDVGSPPAPLGAESEVLGEGSGGDHSTPDSASNQDEIFQEDML